MTTQNTELKLLETSMDVIGVDEAGRGPLAFDVVAAAVIMPKYDTFTEEELKIVKKIKDSKKMTKKARTLCAEFIKQKAIAYGIGTVDAKEIDQINILQATYKAMHKALDMAFTTTPFSKLVVDGDKFKGYITPNGIFTTHECVVGGDNTYFNIAAASVLAKTHHDELICKIVEENPDLEKYGFAKNVGYGTPAHMKSLKEYGPCEYHRRTFLKSIK